MAYTSEFTLAALPFGVEVSFGTIAGTFDYVDAYVDQSAAGPRASRVIWRLYAVLGTQTTLICQSLPMAYSGTGELPFAPIQSIAGASYELRGIAIDSAIAIPIAGALAGSDAEISDPLTSATGTFTLPPEGIPRVYATISGVQHTQFLAAVNANGQEFTASSWELVGTIGPISAVIATGSFAENSSGGPLGYIVFNTAGALSGIEAATAVTNTGVGLGAPNRARGADSYSLVGVGLDGGGSSGPVQATLIGFDLNLVAPVAPSAPGVGLDIVFRAGGVAGGNVYTTWATAYAAASIAAIQGPVRMAIDNSIAVCTVALGNWSMGNPASSTRMIALCNGNPSGESILTIPAGAILTDLLEVDGGQLTLLCSPNAAAQPSLSYDFGGEMIVNFNGTIIQNIGTAPAIRLGTLATPTVNLQFRMVNCLLRGLLGAEIFNVFDATAVAEFRCEAVTTRNISGGSSPDFLLAGAGTVLWRRDDISVSPIADANFTGGLTVSQNANGPDYLAPTGLAAGGVLTVDLLYTSSGQQADQLIACNPGAGGGCTINLPDALLKMNLGRVLTVIDRTGGSGAHPISLVPFAGQNINGVAAPFSLSQNWGTWIVYADGNGNWVVESITVPPAGLDIVYRPGGVAGGNVYTTWVTAYGAATAASVQGPVTIAMDDSIVSPAVIGPPAIYPMSAAGREIWLKSANPTGLTYISIPAATTLLNAPGGDGLMNIECFPAAAGFQSLMYDGTSSSTSIWTNGVTFANGGSVPAFLFSAAGGAGFQVLLPSFSGFFSAGLGSEIFGVAAGNSLSVQVAGASTAGSSPANILSGAGSVSWNRDTNSFSPIANANFTGTLTVSQNDSGPVVLAVTATVGAGATYVVDAAYAASGAQADQLIPCAPLPASITTVQLPDATLPMNAGRTIRIADANGGSVASPIQLTCPGGNTLNGIAGGPKALASNWGQWVVISDGTQWIVSQLAGI